MAMLRKSIQAIKYYRSESFAESRSPDETSVIDPSAPILLSKNTIISDAIVIAIIIVISCFIPASISQTSIYFVSVKIHPSIRFLLLKDKVALLIEKQLQ